jgi:Spy/CpxP family protein refolding chaperone
MTNRNINFRAVSFLILLLALAPRAWPRQSAAPSSQQTPPAVDTQSQQQQSQPSNQDRLELIRTLNLTPEQRARIAEIRQETEAQAQQITIRLRRARRALEQAIYAEHADESVIQQRTKDVADAEAARVQMRSEAELKVRRVLTPEQFATFRELRRQAQVTRQRQNALNGGAAQRPNVARAAQRDAARANNGVAVPTLIPRRQRQNAPNRVPKSRP